MYLYLIMNIHTKTKGAVCDHTLSDNKVMQVMVGAISASWGKLFHIDTELGTKDDLKALVHVYIYCYI